MNIESDATKLVTAAFKVLLGREPAPNNLEARADRLKRDDDVESLLREIIESKEYKVKSAKQSAFPELIAPFWTDRVKRISTDATPGQLDLFFERIRAEWTKLGETEPHWSVATVEAFKSSTFAAHEEEFYNSGRATISTIELICKRAGVQIDPAGTALEFGCGTGRVTHVLADKFARVVAVDVSPGNMGLCREKLNGLGKTNVDYVLLKSPRDIETIASVDFFISTFVFQHNPPPVAYYFLDQILGKIRPSGVAAFQVWTHKLDYSFDAAEYLTSPQPTMEMHILPMRDVFALFKKHGFAPAEVMIDPTANGPGSHTFFAVRE
jgi:SAM-dependent methyltransferase